LLNNLQFIDYNLQFIDYQIINIFVGGDYIVQKKGWLTSFLMGQPNIYLAP